MDLKKLKADLQFAHMNHHSQDSEDSKALVVKAQKAYDDALNAIDDTDKNGGDAESKASSTGKDGASTTNQKSDAGSGEGKNGGADQGKNSKPAGADVKSGTEGDGVQKKTEDPAS